MRLKEALYNYVNTNLSIYRGIICEISIEYECLNNIMHGFSFSNTQPKNMKSTTRTLVFFLLTVFIVSCKKSSNNSSGYYFKASFDGTTKNLNTSVVAAKSNLGSGIYNLTIVGTTSSEEAGVTLWSDQDNFTAGTTYNIDALNGTTNNSLSYTSPLGSSNASSIWNSTYSYGTVNQSFTCTITEATSSYVKGTFSGVIYMNTDSTVVSKSVTLGEFNAKF
jgi:hypothetical protein